MRKLFLFLAIPLLLSSCNLDGDSHEQYTGYVSVYETQIPDSAMVSENISILAKASAPNGCWSNLNIYLGKSASVDTLYGISATGFFESYDGICADVLVTKETTFDFKADTVGTYIFVSYLASLATSMDTLVVYDTVSGKK